MQEKWIRITWPCDNWYTPDVNGKHTNSGFYPETHLREMKSYLASYGIPAAAIKIEPAKVLT